MNIVVCFPSVFQPAAGQQRGHAEGLRFGILGKSTDDINFVDTWRGCDSEAQRFGDQCLYLGNAGPAHLRSQSRAIGSPHWAESDGLAIFVTSSSYCPCTAKYQGAAV